ncbi:hypothetical protein NSK_000354 [Nannochloropsis salina CCMP1776]|uniref:Glycosyltransferase family 28 N-terminal domain-containing protein n=1 Tax=Nannochloropsis salina CCMP1776 TaxID=1027361 RepID=A0A4D9D985_9STRA|nr:hypothetical protein NSK_000354 [Nannochloropsis salina CCMP1776]|eukprot:TFJ88000.1 hypothetical protein NSK_000354 [Nannochloropsis salina CCMP1776]
MSPSTANRRQDTVIFLALGSLGDVLPVLAVAHRFGRRVDRRGPCPSRRKHLPALVFITHTLYLPRLKTLVERTRPPLSQAPVLHIEGIDSPPLPLRRDGPASVPDELEQCLAACRGHAPIALLACNLVARFGVHIGEILGAASSAVLAPSLPPPTPSPSPTLLRNLLGPKFLRLLEDTGADRLRHMEYGMLSLFLPAYHAFRERHGLSSCLSSPSAPTAPRTASHAALYALRGDLPFLYGVSEGFFPKPGYWPESSVFCGAWTWAQEEEVGREGGGEGGQEDGEGWAPDEELRRFVEGEGWPRVSGGDGKVKVSARTTGSPLPPLICLDMGSMIETELMGREEWEALVEEALVALKKVFPSSTPAAALSVPASTPFAARRISFRPPSPSHPSSSTAPWAPLSTPCLLASLAPPASPPSPSFNVAREGKVGMSREGRFGHGVKGLPPPGGERGKKRPRRAGRVQGRHEAEMKGKGCLKEEARGESERGRLGEEGKEGKEAVERLTKEGKKEEEEGRGNAGTTNTFLGGAGFRFLLLHAPDPSCGAGESRGGDPALPARRQRLEQERKEIPPCLSRRHGGGAKRRVSPKNQDLGLPRQEPLPPHVQAEQSPTSPTSLPPFHHPGSPPSHPSSSPCIFRLPPTTFVPHAWLFPRCRLVIHHGGLGTVMACLLGGGAGREGNGVPQLIVPITKEQEMWAMRVEHLGVGRGLSREGGKGRRGGGGGGRKGHGREGGREGGRGVYQALQEMERGRAMCLEKIAQYREWFLAEDGVGRAVDLLVEHMERNRNSKF